MGTIKQFVTEEGLYLYLSSVPFRTDIDQDTWSKDVKHFAYRISRGGSAEKLNGFYSQGSGIKRYPKIEDILNALMMDTMNIDGISFKDWCSEYGYSDDSIKAHKTYTLCLSEYEDMKRFFTKKQLKKLWECETL